MNKPIEGDPAFPSDRYGETGLTERRYYIGQALQGLCANPNLTQASYRDVAGRAITQADAVMQLLYPQTEKETN